MTTLWCIWRWRDLTEWIPTRITTIKWRVFVCDVLDSTYQWQLSKSSIQEPWASHLYSTSWRAGQFPWLWSGIKVRWRSAMAGTECDFSGMTRHLLVVISLTLCAVDVAILYFVRATQQQYTTGNPYSSDQEKDRNCNQTKIWHFVFLSLKCDVNSPASGKNCVK